MSEARHLLSTIPLFGLFDDQELDLLAGTLRRKPFLAGQLIFSLNDPGGEMYVVESGKVEIFLQDVSDTRLSLRQLEAGELFGELSLLDGEPRSATVRAVENSVLVVITRDDLYKLIQQRPESALHMMQILAQRVRTTTAMVQERVIPNVNDEIRGHITLGDRLSDLMTNLSGNIKFVAFSVVWFTLWVLWNTGVIPGVKPFDPFPFGFLTMVVSLEMVFLSLFILIKQARQAANDKVRNDIEYEVNCRAEAGVRALSTQIEVLQEQMLQHLGALESTTVMRRENGYPQTTE